MNESPDNRLAETNLLYNATTLDHISHPRNVGRFQSADGEGTVDDANTENRITIYVRVRSGKITAARFRTFGCSACIAASSAVTILARGLSLSDAHRVGGDSVDARLGGLPAEKRHCADFAAEALQRAAADALSRVNPSI